MPIDNHNHRLAASLTAATTIAANRDAEISAKRRANAASLVEWQRQQPRAADTVVYRITAEAMALAERAWPDPKVRKTEISKLIVKAASDILSATSTSPQVQ